MSDFSVDFTKSYARRRPEELGSPVGAQWEWEPRGLVVFGPVLMAISMGKCCWTMKFSCVFLENNRIDHEILEPVLKTKPNDEVGDENAGVYQRTLVGCNHPKHGYNQQVYLIKMISWDDLMMRSRIVGFIPICWRCVVSTIEASDPWATGARVFVPSFFFRPRCEWISPKGTTIGFFPAKTDGKHQGPLLHGGTNIFWESTWNWLCQSLGEMVPLDFHHPEVYQSWVNI